MNRVEVCVREGIELPGLQGSVSPVQIVSDQALPNVVRLTALHADVAIRSWRKERGESISNWDERLRQIGIIKSRHTVGLERPSESNREDTSFAEAMQDFFD